MNSKTSGKSPNSKGSIEQVISADASKIKSGNNASEELALRLDKVEVLIEELGKTNQLVEKFADYIDAQKQDLLALRRTRFWLVILSVLFVVGTDGTVFLMVLNHSKWFTAQDTYFKGVVFIGTLTMSVVLLSIMLKGAFHSLAERTKDDDGLPPHLKEAMDMIKSLTGK